MTRIGSQRVEGRGGPLADLIYRHRVSTGLKQIDFGAKFGVSGPGILKFEKGYVNPSFKLWMRMAADMGLAEGEAALHWVRAKVPAEHRDRLALRREKGRSVDLSKFMDRHQLRAAALMDETLPKGLKSMIGDEEVWRGYKPTGRELNLLGEFFGRFGDANKAKYRNALRLLRDFTGSEA